MEAIRGFSEREDTLRAPAAHVVSEEHPAYEEHPMRAEWTTIVVQATLRDAITGIPGLSEDDVTAFVILEVQNRAKRADNKVQAMLQGLLNKEIDEKLKSVTFEDYLLRKIEEETVSRQQVKKLTEAMLHNRAFITPVATISRSEARRLWLSNRRRKTDARNLLRSPIVQTHGAHHQATDFRQTSPMN